MAEVDRCAVVVCTRKVVAVGRGWGAVVVEASGTGSVVVVVEASVVVGAGAREVEVIVAAVVGTSGAEINSGAESGLQAAAEAARVRAVATASLLTRALGWAGQGHLLAQESPD